MTEHVHKPRAQSPTCVLSSIDFLLSGLTSLKPSIQGRQRDGFSTTVTKKFLRWDSRFCNILVPQSCFFFFFFFLLLFHLHFQKAFETYITNIKIQFPEHLKVQTPDQVQKIQKGGRVWSWPQYTSLWALKWLGFPPALISTREASAAPSVLPPSPLIIFICLLWSFFKALSSTSSDLKGEAKKNPKRGLRPDKVLSGWEDQLKGPSCLWIPRLWMPFS